jgi:hypothetical protein
MREPPAPSQGFFFFLFAKQLGTMHGMGASTYGSLTDVVYALNFLHVMVKLSYY